MKIESQPLDDHQVKLTVEFEAGVLEDYKRRAARHLANRVKVPGFRPGKAPYQVIARQVGDAALTEEGLEMLVNDKYAQIIDESGVHPFSSGQFDKIVSTEPLILEFSVPLEPEITLGDYQALRRPYELKEISDEDVDEVLENLRERQAVLEPADRPAAEGDVVSVHLTGARLNPAEDQSDNLVEERTYQFLVRAAGKHADDEWPFPGFSQNLVGLSVGDGKTLSYQFSEDYQFETMRGVEGSYQLVVEEIKSRDLPELDEEFVKTIGEYADLAALKAEIRSSLEQQALETYNQVYDDAILAELVEQSVVKYPPQMLESEQNNVVDNFKHRLEQQGTDLDLYLKSREMDLDGLKEEAKPVAEERLKRSLVLLEVAKAENIQVSEEELQSQTMLALRSLNQTLSPEDARRLTDERIMNNLVGNVMLEAMSRKAEERLRDIASGKYVPGESEAVVEADAAVESPAETLESAAEEILTVEETIPAEPAGDAS